MKWRCAVCRLTVADGRIASQNIVGLYETRAEAELDLEKLNRAGGRGAFTLQDMFVTSEALFPLEDLAAVVAQTEVKRPEEGGIPSVILTPEQGRSVDIVLGLLTDLSQDSDGLLATGATLLRDAFAGFKKQFLV